MSAVPPVIPPQLLALLGQHFNSTPPRPRFDDSPLPLPLPGPLVDRRALPPAPLAQPLAEAVAPPGRASSLYIGDWIDRLRAAGTAFGDSLGDSPVRNTAVGAGETALQVGSSLGALFPGVIDAAAGQLGWADPANPSGSYAGARNKYIYPPQSAPGQAGAGLLGELLSPVADLVHSIGGKVGDAAEFAGASKDNAQDVRDFVPDLINLLPFMAGGRAKGMTLPDALPVEPLAGALVGALAAPQPPVQASAPAPVVVPPPGPRAAVAPLGEAVPAAPLPVARATDAVKPAKVAATSTRQKKGLDLSLSARLKRANEMGFSQRTLYHGTNQDVRAFSLAKGSQATGSRVGKLGVSLAEDSDLAAEFAEFAEFGYAGANGRVAEGANVIPVRIRASKRASLQLEGNESDLEIAGAVQDAWDAGYDAIRFTNYTSPRGLKGKNFVLVKSPSQIRSVHAAFDPAKKNSSDLTSRRGSEDDKKPAKTLADDLIDDTPA